MTLTTVGVMVSKQWTRILLLLKRSWQKLMRWVKSFRRLNRPGIGTNTTGVWPPTINNSGLETVLSTGSQEDSQHVIPRQRRAEEEYISYLERRLDAALDKQAEILDALLLAGSTGSASAARKVSAEPQPIGGRRARWSDVKHQYEALKRDEASKRAEAWKARIAEVEAQDAAQAAGSGEKAESGDK
jgi:hypothetical protein